MIIVNNEDYLAGVRAAQNYYNTKMYGGLVRPVRPEDAAKLFLPPVLEMMTPISTPLPKSRKSWIKGFAEEQAAILAELHLRLTNNETI